MKRKSNWISEACFQDTFDWSKSYKTNFIDFFKYVMLHDSYWVAININTDYEAILIIELDAIWNKEYCLKSRENKDWPYLVIKISDLFNIFFNRDRKESIIYSATSKIVTKFEIEKLIELSKTSNVFYEDLFKNFNVNDELHRTRIEDVGDGNIEIYHKSEIKVLLIEKNGKYINPDTHRLNLKSQLFEDKSSNKGLFGKLMNRIKDK